MRFSSPLFVALGLALGGCATGTAEGDAAAANASEEAVVASAVVVADPAATAAAEVFADRIVLPVAVAARYRSLTPGAVFVGARGSTKGKNPDGFLRRVVSITEEADALVIATTTASLTDAIVRGAVRASSGGGTGLDGDVHGQSLKPMTREQLDGIAIDFAGKPLFEGVDEIDVPGGRVRFVESVRFERAVFSSRPVVDVDVRIADGAVSRFVGKVEGNLDTSVKAHASVVAEGEVTDLALAELRARKHDVSRVLYESPRIALPTFAVGGVPVSPSVKFRVTLKCTLSFGGALEADAGVEARSQVRLGAVYQDGAWQPPIRSEFEIAPSFAMTRANELDARCVIEADAELFAYGAAGIGLTVAPFVDIGVKREASAHAFRVKGGATGHLRGSAEVFGVRAPVDAAPLTEWQAPSLVEGTLPP